MSTADPAPGWGLVIGSGVGAGVGAITADEFIGRPSPAWTFGTYAAGATVGGLVGVLVGGALEDSLG